MAMATAASRATGLGRTVALAAVLGVGATSDAYNIANVAPTMIFTLVVGGVLTAGVVPVLARAGDRSGEVASALLGVVVTVGILASAGIAVGAPWFIALLRAGAEDDGGDGAALAISWLRMFAPQVFFYAVSVLAVAVMTAKRRLTLGAAAPVATNVLTIAVAGAFLALTDGRPRSTEDVTGLAQLTLGWGTTLAVGVMAAIQLWGARRCEPTLRIKLTTRDPAVREVIGLGRWVLLYVASNQLGLVAITAMASSTVGGVTGYQWGFTVMQLPYAVAAVSLLSAAMPAAATADGGPERTATLRPVARWTSMLLVPAAVVLAIGATPIASAVVGPSESELVAAATRGFAASLIPFAGYQLLTRTSYAAGDARSPAVVNILVNVVNVGAAAVALMLTEGGPATVTALALAHAVSYVAGCIALGSRLGRRKIVSSSVLARSAAVPVTIGSVMVVAFGWVLRDTDAPTTRVGSLAALAALGLTTAAAFLPLWWRTVVSSRAGVTTAGAAPDGPP
jgi:putative peptidoglycan lipid II flippase